MFPTPEEHPDGSESSAAGFGFVKSMKTGVKSVIRRLTIYGKQHEPELPSLNIDNGSSGSRSDHTSEHTIHGPTPSQLRLKREKLKRTLRIVRLGNTKPVGVLAIHIKRIAIDTVDFYDLFKRNHATIYIRISIQGQMKFTTAYEDVSTPNVILIDEIKHFRVTASETRSDTDNILKFEVLAFNKKKPDIHKIISMKNVHIFDIIKDMASSQSLDLMDMDKCIGDMDVEICFGYGAFGYGYSSLFVNQKLTPEEQVSQALFPRVEPPKNRVDYQNVDILQVKHVGHPSFIDFKNKAKIGPGKDFENDIIAFPNVEKVEEPTLLITRMRKSMRNAQEEYRTKTSRKQRLDYLRQRVSQPGHYTTLDWQTMEVDQAHFKLKVQKATIEEEAEEDPGLGLSLLSGIGNIATSVTQRVRRASINIGVKGSDMDGRATPESMVDPDSRSGTPWSDVRIATPAFGSRLVLPPVRPGTSADEPIEERPLSPLPPHTPIPARRQAIGFKALELQSTRRHSKQASTSLIDRLKKLMSGEEDRKLIRRVAIIPTMKEEEEEED